MTHKIKYDDDADVLTAVVKEKGKLPHAEEVDDITLHVDDKGEPLFLEIPNGRSNTSIIGFGATRYC